MQVEKVADAIYLSVAYALAALGALSIIKMNGLTRILIFYALLTAYKTSLIMLFPNASSWVLIVGSGDAVAAAALMPFYALAVVLVLKYDRVISIKKVLLFAPIGALVGAVLVQAWRTQISPVYYALSAATFSVYGGFGEEVFFRGFVMDELSTRYGKLVALFGQAALFGASHPWNPFVAIGAFALGAVLGVVRLYLGLEACMGLHYGLNIFTHT